MKNEIFLQYDQFDVTALSDAIGLSNDNQSFGNLELLEDVITTKKYMTLEKDLVLLDGTFVEFPDTPTDIVFMSSELSDENGEFVTNPMITIYFFETTHSSIGFVATFSSQEQHYWGKIRFYSIDGSLIALYNFNAYYGINIQELITDYKKIEIEFYGTSPYSFARFSSMKYGGSFLYKEDVIQSGTLVSDFDPISDKLAIGQMTVRLTDEDNDYNLSNQNGIYKAIQQNQKIILARAKNGEVLGSQHFTYYLDSFSSKNGIVTFNTYDRMKFLDNMTFLNGKVYENEKAGLIIESIFASAGIEEIGDYGWANYTIDAITYNTELSGTLGKMTCRQALREVLFACQSVVRFGYLSSFVISKENKTVQSTLSRSRKFSTSVDKSDYVSEVSVKHNNLKLVDTVVQILSATYPAGMHTIEFASPVSDLTTSVGTIVEQSAYYCILTLASESAIILSGKRYQSQEIITTSKLAEINGGEIPKNKTFTAMLSDSTLGSSVSAKILDYYQSRLLLDARFVNEAESTGDWSVVENSNEQYADYIAGIESITTDITGFISTAKMRGYYQQFTTENYCGEFRCGERGFM